MDEYLFKVNNEDARTRSMGSFFKVMLTYVYYFVANLDKTFMEFTLRMLFKLLVCKI